MRIYYSLLIFYSVVKALKGATGVKRVKEAK
jgi:hypothetical protein